MLRSVFIFACFLALTSCGDQLDDRMYTGHDPAEERLVNVDMKDHSVELDGQGLANFNLQYGDNSQFGAERESIEAYLASELGAPVERDRYRDCPSGTMELSEFNGSLFILFQDGKFVGWFLEDGEHDHPIMLSEGISLPSTFGEFEFAYDAWMVAGSRLGGDDFLTSVGIGGTLYENTNGIYALYAGTNCF